MSFSADPASAVVALRPTPGSSDAKASTLARPQQSDRYLTIPEAHVYLQHLGFADLTLRQVVRWSNEKKLPFFRMGKKCCIEEKELAAAIKRRQLDAAKNIRH